MEEAGRRVETPPTQSNAAPPDTCPPSPTPSPLPIDKRYLNVTKLEGYFKLEGGDPLWGDDLRCPHYRLEGAFTLNEIDAFVRETRAEHPGHVLLATLDDFDQASYTSFHATDRYDLDRVDGHDLSNLAPDQIEPPYNGVGEPRRAYAFSIRYANFMELVSGARLDDLTKFLWWAGREEGPGHAPSFLVPDDDEANLPIDRAFVQIVPVQGACEAIAAFPNGYFESDASPEDNYAICKALQEQFGLTLFGIGATYLGFHSPDVLDRAKSREIANFIVNMYDNDPPPASQIADRLEGQTTFYLSYIGERWDLD